MISPHSRCTSRSTARDHGPTPPERRDDDQPLVGHQLDGQQGKRDARRRIPTVLDRISVGPVLPRRRQLRLPGAAGLGLLSGANGGRGTISSGRISGEPSSLC
jgi:hypothetical protein